LKGSFGASSKLEAESSKKYLSLPEGRLFLLNFFRELRKNKIQKILLCPVKFSIERSEAYLTGACPVKCGAYLSGVNPACPVKFC
jgi:hypothetical protein